MDVPRAQPGRGAHRGRSGAGRPEAASPIVEPLESDDLPPRHTFTPAQDQIGTTRMASQRERLIQFSRRPILEGEEETPVGLPPSSSSQSRIVASVPAR